MNYYNEFDPGAAAWLKELIKAGAIPPGIVDTRSIVEVMPGDLAGFTQCHFFAGIGGWSLALALAGWRAEWPVWTGSCPCQPFSVAGKGLGTDDERHLWPQFRRLIADCKPSRVFGEQVASKDGRTWLTGVRADLEALGYGVGGADLCAASIGAPHIRQRLFWVADSAGVRWREESTYCARNSEGDSAEGQTRRIAECSHDSRLADSDSERCIGKYALLRAEDNRRFGTQTIIEASGCSTSSRLADSISGGCIKDRECRRLVEVCQRRINNELSFEKSSPCHNGGLADAALSDNRGVGRLGAAGDGRPAEVWFAEGTGDARSGCGNGWWDDYYWIPCADGKARRLKPGLSPLVNGFPSVLAFVCPECGEKYPAYTEETEECRRWAISSTVSLQCGHLPRVWENGQRAASAPYQSGCNGQQTGEYPDPLLPLSFAEASEAPSRINMLNLRKSICSEGSPEACQMLQPGVCQRDGSQMRLEAVEYNRIGAIRGFGNAIVPQVAAEFIAAYMECGV